LTQIWIFVLKTNHLATLPNNDSYRRRRISGNWNLSLKWPTCRLALRKRIESRMFKVWQARDLEGSRSVVEQSSESIKLSNKVQRRSSFRTKFSVDQIVKQSSASIKMSNTYSFFVDRSNNWTDLIDRISALNCDGDERRVTCEQRGPGFKLNVCKF
jgi:hypothetical protein